MERNVRSVITSMWAVMAAATILLSVAGTAFGQSTALGRGEFTLTVTDTDIDAPFDIVDADTGFTQMSANATISARYTGSNSDTAYVNIRGVGIDSVVVDTMLRVDGGDTVVTARTFHAFENSWMAESEAGNVEVFITGGNQLDSLTAGAVSNPTAHVLFGKSKRNNHGLPQIESVHFLHESLEDTTVWELRVWNTTESTRTLTTGYHVIARARLHANQNESYQVLNYSIPSEGFAAAFVKGVGGTDLQGTVILKGQRR